MKTIARAKLKDDLSSYPRRAEREEIVITRHGRPAGVLIGFEIEDDTARRGEGPEPSSTHGQPFC